MKLLLEISPETTITRLSELDTTIKRDFPDVVKDIEMKADNEE